VEVLDCTSQQAGIAALVEFNPDADAAANATRLAELLATVQTAAVAPAARDDAEGRFARGDAVGFVGDRVVAWGEPGPTLAATVAHASAGAEIVTVFEGADVPISRGQLLTEIGDGVDVEVKTGGQSSYWWLITAQ
jgi:dihydroxyacetone kinase-like predicted kinase